MAKTPASPVPADVPADTTTGGKGRATPTRAEQEAARKRPLVADTKEAKARAKAELAAQREKARVGMAAGEDRYLPVRDKGPQRSSCATSSTPAGTSARPSCPRWCW